jgi:hypothetical protein
MTRHALFSLLIATVAGSLSAAGCTVVAPAGSGGATASATGTGDTSSADASGAGGSASATTSSATTAGSTTASTGTGMGIPCVALKDGMAPNPTPGTCQGNVAVTCGQDGFLTQEACSAGTTCSTYELSEWRFDGAAVNPKWVAGRTVTWAGCKPQGTTSCTMAFNGDYYAPTMPAHPHCNGQDQIACRTPPAPDLFSSYPQLQYGTKDGWLVTTPCGPNQRCAGSDTWDVLTCIDASTPSCDGTEPFCSGQGIVECQGTWESQPGYRVTQSCGADQCYTGTQGPFCAPPGEVACDAASFGPPRCEADGTSVVSCWNGFTSHQSCATCLDEHGQTVACRCDALYAQSGWSWNGTSIQCNTTASPACVPQVSVDCDPATEPDTCNGDVAHRCLGHWEDLDCAAHGLTCGVTNGLAGCKAANAPTCDAGAYQDHCDGTTMVGCCACGHADFLFGASPVPCAPGYEVRTDCASLGANYSCKSVFMFGPVECQYTP